MFRKAGNPPGRRSNADEIALRGDNIGGVGPDGPEGARALKVVDLCTETQIHKS